MKIGLDTFTIRELELDFIGQLDFIKKHNLAGAQLHDVPANLSEMKKIKEHADKLGLFVNIAVTPCNPLFTKDNETELVAKLTQDITNAAQCNWHELRTIMGDHLTRYKHKNNWQEHIEATIRVLKKLKPVLLKNGSRLNIENHGDATTHDLLRIIKEVGEDTTGICLDTGNLLVLGEDPVAATLRAAPYVHLTHAKDAILFFAENTVRRQGKAPGQGIVNWQVILKILSKFNPTLPICIEDHKWFFDIPVYDANWHAEQPDLTARELGAFIGLASSCHHKIQQEQILDPEEYEKIPYLEQLEERINSGREFLLNTLRQIENKP